MSDTSVMKQRRWEALPVAAAGGAAPVVVVVVVAVLVVVVVVRIYLCFLTAASCFLIISAYWRWEESLTRLRLGTISSREERSSSWIISLTESGAELMSREA